MLDNHVLRIHRRVKKSCLGIIIRNKNTCNCIECNCFSFFLIARGSNISDL